jgi:uncharacterized tellurite resistance protein B-like protein
LLDSIRGFVSRRVFGASSSPDTSAAGSATSHPSGVQIAACALLLELAHADGEFSATERAHIESALGRHFGLDELTTRELLALAEAERRESIDHFQFTRLIVQQYDLGQKMVLAEVMWGVVLADGEIATHEGWLVRKLAHLLELEPGYLAEAKKSADGKRK